jgi:hypothetical protein
VAVSFNTPDGGPCCDGLMNAPDFDAAATFVAANARVLDRRRFERLFQGGDATPVRDAVAAYRNDDGGFGHALEPDLRDPASQPAATAMAFRMLDETGSWDEELVRGACDWLESVAPAEGGATMVNPSVAAWPHAPWWVPEDGRPASLIQTGMIAGTLHARGVRHPWLDRATEVMWARLDALAEPGAYDMFGVLGFLQQVPDRDRARKVFERVGPLIFSQNLVALDPDAPGEVHSPLGFAPEPDSLARELFDEATIKAHLDHLAQAQRDDGGWTFNWPAWSPAAEREWRGFLTVDALRLLRANGRTPQHHLALRQDAPRSKYGRPLNLRQTPDSRRLALAAFSEIQQRVCSGEADDMNPDPTTIYRLGYVQLAEMHRQAEHDSLARTARRARRRGRAAVAAAGRPTVLTRWTHRLGLGQP